LMQAPVRRKDTSREQEVASISRSLKIMAMDLRVPVIICAQLNRQSEQRGDGMPRVSDLRESGALEQDADAVILLHRDPDPEKANGELNVLVGKNRHGPTGPLALSWRAHISRLDNLGLREVS
jgi:replicative DNA helicase